jgi:hypothetical protein
MQYYTHRRLEHFQFAWETKFYRRSKSNSYLCYDLRLVCQSVLLPGTYLGTLITLLLLSDLEIREYGHRDPSANLALTSPIIGGCSDGIVRLRIQATEFISVMGFLM